MAKIVLGNSVVKECRNISDDVKAVRKRLRELGFVFVSADGPGEQADFVKAIKLFQAICDGQTKLKMGGRVNGKIKSGDWTDKWLAVSLDCFYYLNAC